jgi:2'-5' RNA ligase
MPTLTPGAQRIPLTNRLSAAWQALRGISPDLYRALGGPQQNLTQVPFGPGQPIEPQALSADQHPRQFEYPVGANLSLRPRGEYPKLTLTPFEQLRNLARFYDVASICIETRINWLTTVKWSVVAKDKRRQSELQQLCVAVENFWKKPDGVTPFPTWLSAILKDQLEIDALTLYKQRGRIGRLLRLQYIDGATIKPLLDERGRTSAYQQVLYGYVRGEYDREDIASSDPYPVGGDMLYLPRWVSTDSPYGRSPTEQIILRVNMAIRKQTLDLGHFTDGNVPPGLWAPPEGVTMQPEQVRQFEDAFNADLAGDDRQRNRIKMMPYDGKYTELRPFQYSTVIDEWMLEITCASFHVPKNELGMTDKVNKASSQEQEDVTARHMTGPDSTWLKTVLLDPIIQEDLTYLSPLVSELEWSWNFGETEDVAKVATVQQGDVKAGIISADESRRMRYPDLDGNAPGTPPVSAPAAGSAPIAQLAKGDTPGSAMVAFFLPAEVARELYLETDDTLDELAEPMEDLHLTLVYLGSTAEQAAQQQPIRQALRQVCRELAPLEGTIGGIGRFTGDPSGITPVYASFDSPALPAFREAIVGALQEAGVSLPEEHGFTPHITLAYIRADWPMPDLRFEGLGPVRFESFTLAWGGKRLSYPLLGGQVQKAETTVTTATGLVGSDLARPKRKRKRRSRSAPTLDAKVIQQAQELYRQVRGGNA